MLNSSYEGISVSVSVDGILLFELEYFFVNDNNCILTSIS